MQTKDHPHMIPNAIFYFGMHISDYFQLHTPKDSGTLQITCQSPTNFLFAEGPNTTLLPPDFTANFRYKGRDIKEFYEDHYEQYNGVNYYYQKPQPLRTLPTQTTNPTQTVPHNLLYFLATQRLPRESKLKFQESPVQFVSQTPEHPPYLTRTARGWTYKVFLL